MQLAAKSARLHLQKMKSLQTTTSETEYKQFTENNQARRHAMKPANRNSMQYHDMFYLLKIPIVRHFATSFTV